jgi:hypothetical protein
MSSAVPGAGQVAELPVFAVHTRVQYPAPLADVPHFERADLLAPQSVVEEHREDGAIALALLCLGPGRVEGGHGLSVVQGPRLALVALLVHSGRCDEARPPLFIFSGHRLQERRDQLHGQRKYDSRVLLCRNRH